MRCRVCDVDTGREGLTHLSLYVAGSEGVDVCLHCRVSITDYVRGMMSACARLKHITIKRWREEKGL